VDAAAAGFDADRVLEVEHLVVEEVLDGAARGVGTVEDAADDDGIVGGVVVAQHAACVVRTPRKGGAAEEAMEEAGIEGFEDLVEVVVMAYGGEDALAATGLADVLGLTGDGFGGDMAAVTVGVGGGDGFFVELGEQDVGDGAVDGLGGMFEKVRQADMEAAFAEADGGVERGEAVEADVKRRYGCAGPEVPVLLFKYGDEWGGHYGLRLARWLVGWGRDGYRNAAAIVLFYDVFSNGDSLGHDAVVIVGVGRFLFGSDLLFGVGGRRTRSSGLRAIGWRIRGCRGWLRGRACGRRCRLRCRVET